MLKDKLGDDSLIGQLSALKKRVRNLEDQLKKKSDNYNELLARHQEMKSDFDEAKRQASVRKN